MASKVLAVVGNDSGVDGVLLNIMDFNIIFMGNYLVVIGEDPLVLKNPIVIVDNGPMVVDMA
jgi:hypothetical protein